MGNLAKLVNIVFLDRTDNALIQLFRTAVIGVISLAIDLAFLYALTEAGMYYLFSVFFSFWFSLAANYLLIRKFVFVSSKLSRRAELAGYLAVALTALVLTEILMYVFTEKLGIFYMLSKFLAAVVVLLWTFSARKFWLYRS